MVSELAGIAKAALDLNNRTDQAWLNTVLPTEAHIQIAQSLSDAKTSALMLGQLAQSHQDYTVLQKLASIIAAETRSSMNILPLSANEAGAHLVNFVPKSGFNSEQMIQSKLKGFINFDLEPEVDFAQGQLALKAMQQAEFVVNLSMFDSAAQRDYANVLLPIATFAETAGTFVNANGLKQSFKMAVEPKGDAKAGWKVLRVLANVLNINGFDYTHSNEVLREVLDNQTIDVDFSKVVCTLPTQNNDALVNRVSPYAIDSLVRRAASLQATPDATVVTMVRG
jgi:NADH-quinone oxidoreductase subunit G